MESALSTLSSPVVLFFVLGALAAFARSDLAIPEAVAKGMSLYLMAAIGLKGGVEVAASGASPGMAAAFAGGVLLSLSLPVLAFALLRTFGRVDAINAGAIAAHYGSVSVVTFVAGTEMLTAASLAPAGYMVAVLAVMETPAILVGLWLAQRGGGIAKGQGDLWREVLLNGSVVLLIGSFGIGMIAGKDGFAPVAPVFETAFRGVLCLFLLDMGLIAVRRLMQSRALTWRLASLGVALPVMNGIIGAGLAAAFGLTGGTAAALAILAASASYIAVPAAMRMALPQADAGLYLALSLGVTFPFNLTIGIPLYTAIAQRLTGG